MIVLSTIYPAALHSMSIKSSNSTAKSLIRLVPRKSPPYMVEAELMASPSLPVTKSVKPNPQPPLLQPPSVKIREEGELSSSSEDKEKISSGSKERLSGFYNPVGAVLNKGAVDIIGKENTAMEPLSQISNVDATNIQAQSSLQSDSRISVANIPVPFRSSTAKWIGKSGPNDDLVIVFSDDETGSDSECKQKKTTEDKAVMFNSETRKPTPSSYLEAGLSQKAKGFKAKFQPNRRIFTRTFTFAPSNTNSYGTKLKDAAKPQVKPGFVIKNHNTVDQKVVKQSCKPKQDTCLDVGELQDLRQKIAIRETEIKLKSSRKIREVLAGSSQRYDSSNTKTSIQKREKARAAPSAYVHPEVTEPDKKRMKYDSSGQRKQPDTVELVKQGDPDSDPSGGKFDVSCQRKRQALLNQHADTVLGIIDCQKEPDSLGDEFRKGFYINSSGMGNNSVLSLFAMEEMHDKELEEAQKDRRRCEIEEGIARKKYCEAQSALTEATGRCNSLYRQREQSSIQILSLLTGDVHLRCATRLDQVDNTTRVSIAKDKSLQVLLELENSLEKALKEAQEFRHKCEIDERSFLKAYRRAQYALIEASDRCSYQYRERQQLVTRANIEFYSRCYNQFESSTVNNLNTQSRLDLDKIRSSQYARHAHTDVNQADYDSTFRRTPNDLATVPYQYIAGNNKGSENSSEPDSSSSEPLPHPDNNAGHLLCSSNSISATFSDRDEQTLMSADKPGPPKSICAKQSAKAETKNVLDDGTHRTFPAHSDQIFLLQEAKLRSELCARLGLRPLSQKISSDNKSNQHSVDIAAANDINRDKPEPYTSSELPLEEKSQISSHEVDPAQDGDTRLSFRSVACSPYPVLRSTFSYIKNSNSAFCQSMMPQAMNLDYTYNNISNFKGSNCSSEKTLFSALEDNRVLSVKDIFSKQYESYSCNLEADPFWPLCMYELRGKCNDEQCCWQHIKACVNQKTTHLGSVACSIRQQFPISTAASRLLQRKMLNAELSGHVGIQRFQANESNRKLSCLQSRGTLAQLENNVPDVESSLETALIIIDQEIDKFMGANEALLLLSKAIEVNPNSSATWIMYLLVYYSSKRSDKKDDMFLYAVKNNARSYELWLLYINSRLELGSRLVAYDKALSALCSELSVPQSESDTGSLILDIYLQMLDLLCVSGQAEKAIAKVLELVHSASTSDESHPLLSRLYSLLSVPDKCILWVCCVFLGVYRRLPEAVVHQFEMKKELAEIDWPAIELIDDEMQSAKKLMIAVERIVDLCVDIDVVSLDRFTVSNLKSLYWFAVNHFRCKVTLEGFNSGKLFAEKYIKLYPTCRELVLLMARMFSNDSHELSVSGFEEALRNWPKEVYGIHCIWNQYAAHALEKQRFDIAREVLFRWYESAYKCQLAKYQLSEEEGYVSQIQDTPSDSLSREDNMFEYLNLALYHKLRCEHQEAQLAVNKALEIAPSDLFKHCVREHASFHLIDVQHMDDTSISSIVEILNGYMFYPCASIASCILSRKFISDLKKPRVQQLFKKFLAEISPDCAILNSALEAWFGPSLLPRICISTKQLVNFVEAVMEIVPTNHQFASENFRHVSKDFNSKDVSTSSLLFWASNLLVNSIIEAVPAAPEFVWVEAAALLGSSTSILDVCEKFHERAVSVHPFSKRLWKSYLNMSSVEFSSKSIIERARRKGIQLELPQQMVG